MKFLRSIGDILFNKMYVITMVSIIMFCIKMLDSHLFLDGRSYFQIFSGLFAIIMVVMTMIIPNNPVSYLSKPWKIFNYISGLIIVLAGIFLLNDYKQRPLYYSELGDLKQPIITTTYFKVVLEFPSGYVLYNKSDVKFDSIYPLKAYQSYKIDIFGKKSPGQICVKSDLMKDYLYPIKSGDTKPTEFPVGMTNKIK